MPTGTRNEKKKMKHHKEEHKNTDVKKQTREREERISSTVEILQMILNEKKNSLLRDPEVTAYLKGAIKKTTETKQENWLFNIFYCFFFSFSCFN